MKDKIMIGLVCLLLFAGCSANGIEEETIFVNESINETHQLGVGIGAKVSADMHCMCPERWCLCFVDRLLIELEKGVYALNLSYYRKTNTSYEDDAISIFDK